MFVLAMGKMGAGELNYSSDIDLIVLFDETRHDPDDYADLRRGFIRVTQRLVKLLSEVTGEGYVFRTDLRLRPDPSVTPVCIATEPAEHYYESLGRTWERAAYIKARACAGAIAAGEAFLDRLRPFVWRKPSRLLGDRGRPGHAAAHPRPQGPGRPDRGPRPRHQARPRRHPRDRVLHPDPPAHRRRPRPRASASAPPCPPSPRSRPRAGSTPRPPPSSPPPTSRTASSSTGCRCSRTPRPSACPRSPSGLARLAAFCGDRRRRTLTADLAAAPRRASSALTEPFFAQDRTPTDRPGPRGDLRRPRRRARPHGGLGAPAGVPHRARPRHLPPPRARAPAPHRRDRQPRRRARLARRLPGPAAVRGAALLADGGEPAAPRPARRHLRHRARARALPRRATPACSTR